MANLRCKEGEQGGVIYLFLSPEKDYFFTKGVYIDKDGKKHDLVMDVHEGVTSDSVLLSYDFGVDQKRVVCRYICGLSSIRIYHILEGIEKMSALIISNDGKRKLQVSYMGRKKCRWILDAENMGGLLYLVDSRI